MYNTHNRWNKYWNKADLDGETIHIPLVVGNRHYDGYETSWMAH